MEKTLEKTLTKLLKKTAIAVLALGVAAPALAHPGHGLDSGLVAGLLHPLTGVDHLLAMLAVGLWSRQQRHGALLAPTFLLMMALGAAAGGGVRPHALELSVAATVILLGALAACAPALQRRVPPPLAMATVGACAFVHGLAHGSELAGLASGVGFILASLALMLIGALPAARLGRPFGAAIGAAGVWLAAVAA